MKNVTLLPEFDFLLEDMIYTDEKRLRQIIFNLVGNALKFTNEGSITIKVK
jgi:signal transduction histidine kinase